MYVIVCSILCCYIDNTAAIAGGAVAGCIVIVVIIVGVACVRTKSKGRFSVVADP